MPDPRQLGSRPEGQLPLPAETVTIAEVAKAAGYATATFGKWGMGFFDSTGAPQKQGVDHFFGYNCQRLAHSYFPTYLHHNDQPFLLPGNDGIGVGKTYAQELIQNDMIRWLMANAEKPFFMFYAITLTHARHEIDDFGIYKDKPWSEQEKAYAAQVTRIDSDVGQLLDTLRDLGIDKNTLVFFKIFAASHRPDPHWPLDRLSDEMNKSREEAWKVTTERRKSQWAPENAKPISK